MRLRLAVVLRDLQRSLEGDDALKHSMARIRALMGEANISLPTNLFEDVIGNVGATPRRPVFRDGA